MGGEVVNFEIEKQKRRPKHPVLSEVVPAFRDPQEAADYEAMIQNTETFARLVLADVALANQGAQPADLPDIDAIEHTRMLLESQLPHELLSRIQMTAEAASAENRSTRGA
jgi:hypothetical protein